MLETQINHTKINTNTHIERINVIIYESFVTHSTTIQYNNLRVFLFRLIQSNTHVYNINLSYLIKQVCCVVFSYSHRYLILFISTIGKTSIQGKYNFTPLFEWFSLPHLRNPHPMTLYIMMAHIYKAIQKECNQTVLY